MLFFKFSLCTAVVGGGLYLFNRYGISPDNDNMTIGAAMLALGTVGALVRMIWAMGEN